MDRQVSDIVRDHEVAYFQLAWTAGSKSTMQLSYRDFRRLCKYVVRVLFATMNYGRAIGSNL